MFNMDIIYKTAEKDDSFMIADMISSASEGVVDRTEKNSIFPAYSRL